MICDAGNWSYKMYNGPGTLSCDYNIILEQSDKDPQTTLVVIIVILLLLGVVFCVYKIFSDKKGDIE